MDNLEHLEKAKNGKLDWDVIRQVCEHEIEYRKMKALEIIAEELCKTKNIIDSMDSTLINIETILNKR